MAVSYKVVAFCGKPCIKDYFKAFLPVVVEIMKMYAWPVARNPSAVGMYLKIAIPFFVFFKDVNAIGHQEYTYSRI